jgi:acyl carrier protein
MNGGVQSSELQTLVFEAFADFGADADSISLDARLEALGIDSLDMVELGQIVQDRYGVKLLAEEFKDLVTVGDALDVIERQLR